MYHGGGVTWRNGIEIFWNITVVRPVVIGNFGHWEKAKMFCKSQRPRDKSCESGVMR